MNVSDQSWIGTLPHGWEQTALRWVLSERKELNKLREETNILSVTNDRGVIRYADKGNIGNKASDDIERYKKVYKGDIVANSMNVIIGSVGIAPEDGVLSPVYIVMQPTTDTDTRYFDYIFKTKLFQSQLRRIGYGILDHRMRIPWGNMKVQVIPKPTLQIQKKISDYLDIETTKIDHLIAKQERLLGLLEEKRRATITCAIHPTSGTTEQRFRDICMINPSTELNFKDDDVVSFYPMESIGDDGTIDHTQTRSYSAVKTGYTIFQNGDVTVAKVTPCFENYKGAHMVGMASGVGFGTTELFVLRASEKVTPEYLYWLTQAQDLNNYLAGGMRGTGGLKRVVPEELKNYKFNIPTPETQKRIVSRLVEGLKKFELLKQKAVKQIELLKERRISLISNVVTGKVKV